MLLFFCLWSSEQESFLKQLQKVLNNKQLDTAADAIDATQKKLRSTEKLLLEQIGSSDFGPQQTSVCSKSCTQTQHTRTHTHTLSLSLSLSLSLPHTHTHTDYIGISTCRKRLPPFPPIFVAHCFLHFPLIFCVLFLLVCLTVVKQHISNTLATH